MRSRILAEVQTPDSFFLCANSLRLLSFSTQVSPLKNKNIRLYFYIYVFLTICQDAAVDITYKVEHVSLNCTKSSHLSLELEHEWHRLISRFTITTKLLVTQCEDLSWIVCEIEGTRVAILKGVAAILIKTHEEIDLVPSYGAEIRFVQVYLPEVFNGQKICAQNDE